MASEDDGKSIDADKRNVEGSDPFSFGGPTTVDNLRVLCEMHNDLAAREAYGDARVERHRATRRADDGAQLPTGWEAVGAR